LKTHLTIKDSNSSFDYRFSLSLDRGRPMNKLISEQLAEVVVNIQFDELPSPVIEQAKMCILDLLGSIYAGIDTQPIKIISDMVKEIGGTPEATIIGDDIKTSSLLAAFYNAAAGHVVEMDDLHRTSILHPGAPVIPAALAIAEREKRSGKELIQAIVAGYEVAIRIGEAAGPTHYEFWHTTGTCGTFGAAIAAGKLLELDQERLIAVLGNAGTQAAGLWEFLIDGAMSKQLHTGKAAMNGVLAALLAQKGFTGAKKILEGEKGFLRATSTDYNLDKITENLDPDLKNFKIMSDSFKPYASCRHTHSAIDATLELVRKYNLKPKDIQEINVQVYSGAYALLDGVTPTTPYAAKFCLPFCVASALKHRTLGLTNFTPQALNDPEIHQLMNKVHMQINSELDREYPEKWPALVKIKSQTGTILKTMVEYPKGDPENPMTKDEIIDKFQGMTGVSITIPQKEWIINQILRLENVEHIATLFENV